MKNQKFKYGWCYSDLKDGREINRWNDPTYRMVDPSTGNFVSQTLELYGLPKPNIEKEVFRGTNHDLLFLDSHGVVIRIGYTDIEELINPGIIQPLHWMNDENTGITVALYPGFSQEKSKMDLSELRAIISSFESKTNDIDKYNSGIVHVGDRDVTIHIDPDHKLNGKKNTSYRSQYTINRL